MPGVHFILTALGSYGDVHPMIGLGATLRERGHEVEVIANPHFEQEITQGGLGFVPLGSAEQYEELTKNPNLWHARRGAQVILRLASTLGLEPLYDLLAERIRPGQTTIAAHGLDLASRLAAEKLGVPVALINYAPMSVWSRFEPPKLPIALSSKRLPSWLNEGLLRLGERFVLRPRVGPPLNRMREKLDLKPIGKLFPDWWYDAGKSICLFPEWFAPPQRDWPENTVCAGFPLWDGGQHQPLSDACREFLDAGAPPIVFTPGSANRQAKRFFQAAVDACQRIGRRGVLLSKYDDHLPASLPESVTRFEFEPLTRILPRAAAFVHHGGIGSSSQAMEAGVPQLIRPLGFDQPDNAERLRKLGVAEELSPRRFTADRLAVALDRLVSSAEVRLACDRVSKLCNGAAARTAACKELETLATE